MAHYQDIADLQARIEATRDWLNKNAPECFTDQKHTHEGTQERIYWHYGYMVALRDALRFLTGTVEPEANTRNAGRSDSRNAA
jgi:hypothetical protein